jgi:acetyl esterase/lipase
VPVLGIPQWPKAWSENTMEMVRQFLCVVLFVLCSSGEGGINQNKVAEPFDDLSITRDVAYAPGDRHGLDIYASRTPGGPRPIIVFIYGGGWTSGTKANYAWVGAALARRGYIAVVPDYRLYPQAHWPQFLEDCAAAVKWAREHMASYGGDPSALVLMGHSAGAYNAFALAVDRRRLAQVGMDPRRDLKAVVGLSGPYTMEPHGLLEDAIFDVRNGYTEPIDHADGKSPPLLLLIGDKDKAVEPRDSDQVAAKIRELGGVAEVIHYPPLEHNGTLEALGGVPGQTAPVMDDIVRFLAAQGVGP